MAISLSGVKSAISSVISKVETKIAPIVSTIQKTIAKAVPTPSAIKPTAPIVKPIVSPTIIKKAGPTYIPQPIVPTTSVTGKPTTEMLINAEIQKSSMAIPISATLGALAPTLAPILGTAIGGPVGGAIGGIVGGLLPTGAAAGRGTMGGTVIASGRKFLVIQTPSGRKITVVRAARRRRYYHAPRATRFDKLLEMAMITSMIHKS